MEMKEEDNYQRKGIPTSSPRNQHHVKLFQASENGEDNKNTASSRCDTRTSEVRKQQLGNEEDSEHIVGEETFKKGHVSKKQQQKQKIKQLNRHVKELTEGNEMLQNRLKAAGVINITDNNPNVTDQIDVEEPEKLLEKFAELYKKEWKFAFEKLIQLQNKQKDQSIKLLLHILKEVYDMCISSRKDCAKTLRQAMLFYVGLSAEASCELELTEIEKEIWEYRKKKSKSNITRIQEEVKQKFCDGLERDLSSTLNLYIDGCVCICWYMCNKNPPMHLDFGEVNKSITSDTTKPVMSHFDVSKFTYYSNSGLNINYVVWPAVYLQEGGKIMEKGVAEAL